MQQQKTPWEPSVPRRFCFCDESAVLLWSDFDQFCDAAGSDPFGDEQVTVGCEAGIVGVYELAVFPLIWFASQVLDFVESFDSASQSSDDFIFFIEQRDAGFEFRHEHQVSVGFDVGRQSEAAESFAVDSVHRKDLQCVVGAVCNDDGRIFAGSIIDPQSVGGIEGAFAFTGSSERTFPVAVAVEAMDGEGSVAVSEQEAAVVEEGEVGGQEALSVPGRLGGGVFAFCVEAGFHGSFFVPDDFAVEGHFGEGFDLLVGGDVEEFLCAFFADFYAVSAALELCSEGADKFSCGVEYEDGRVVFEFPSSFVDDVEISGTVESDVVGGLPGVFIGELGEVMNSAVLIFAFTDDGFVAEAASGV